MLSPRIQVFWFKIFFISSLIVTYNSGYGLINGQSLLQNQMAITPIQISGNVLWLDGSDVNGDGLSGGEFEDGTTWIDKSPAGNANAIQSNERNLPELKGIGLNGLSTLSFTQRHYFDLDSSSFSMLKNVSGVTLFAVLKPSSNFFGQRVIMISTNESIKTRAGLSLFDHPDYDQFGSYLGGDGDFGVTGRVLDSDIFQRVEGGAVSIGRFHQYTGILDFVNGRMELYVNKNLVVTTNLLANSGRTSNTNSSNIRIGADARTDAIVGIFLGEIAELIVYNRVLEQGEREEIEKYLEGKWLYNESSIGETNIPISTFSQLSTDDSSTEITVSEATSPISTSSQLSTSDQNNSDSTKLIVLPLILITITFVRRKTR